MYFNLALVYTIFLILDLFVSYIFILIPLYSFFSTKLHICDYNTKHLLWLFFFSSLFHSIVFRPFTTLLFFNFILLFIILFILLYISNKVFSSIFFLSFFFTYLLLLTLNMFFYLYFGNDFKPACRNLVHLHGRLFLATCCVWPTSY